MSRKPAEKTMEETCKKVVEALRKRGFEATYCATKEDAATAVLDRAILFFRVQNGTGTQPIEMRD